jgi:predicted nucleic acid-binding protein
MFRLMRRLGSNGFCRSRTAIWQQHPFGASRDLLVPDFWPNEATNILWLQVRRKLFTPDEAREGLALLRAQVEPTPTAHMRLHDLALDIGMVIDHSTYDALYLAFAVAMGASAVVAADGPFLQSIRARPCPR